VIRRPSIAVIPERKRLVAFITLSQVTEIKPKKPNSLSCKYNYLAVDSILVYCGADIQIVEGAFSFSEE
jgi:hypothetical protein